MEKRTLNLIFALITGKGNIPDKLKICNFDLWEYKPAVKFFADLFIQSVLGNTNEINPENFGGFHPIALFKEYENGIFNNVVDNKIETIRKGRKYEY